MENTQVKYIISSFKICNLNPVGGMNFLRVHHKFQRFYVTCLFFNYVWTLRQHNEFHSSVAVKEKEEGQIDSEARPMNNEAFGEYRCGSKFLTQRICRKLVSYFLCYSSLFSMLHNDLQISGEVKLRSGFVFVVHAWLSYYCPFKGIVHPKKSSSTHPFVFPLYELLLQNTKYVKEC